MTQKDYIKLAVAFKGVRPPQPVKATSLDLLDYTARHEQWFRDVQAIAGALAADNPRFDFIKFYRATGVAH